MILLNQKLCVQGQGQGQGGLLEEPVEQKKKRWMRAPGNVYLYTSRQKT